MDKSDQIPDGYRRVKVVSSFHDLMQEKFGGPDEVNAIVLPRSLTGNFKAAAVALANKGLADQGRGTGSEVSADELEKISRTLGTAARPAIERIRLDMTLLSANFNTIALRVIPASGGDRDIPHADRGKVHVITGRLLCNYTNPATEIFRNEDIYKTQGPDGGYRIAAHAQPFSFDAGGLWRLAPENAGVPPLIHRRPASKTPRLLLVADNFKPVG